MSFIKKYWKIIVTAILAVLSASLLVSTIVLANKNAKRAQVIKEQKEIIDHESQKGNEVYDFYLTMGTMPTLYATLNAYQNKNPNTYMWFYRGNTISKQYSADYIHYFNSQSTTNKNSSTDYKEIRNKVRDIFSKNPSAKFNLYCDDLRVRYVLDIFVAAGVDFEDLNVVLLSDGTGTYSNYANITEEDYSLQATKWANYVNEYVANRSNKDFTKFSLSNTSGDQAMELQNYAFYLSTFSNVSYWIQHPDYLKNDNSTTLNTQRYNMNIVKKDPKAIYNSLDVATKNEYQQVVLANALVDSTTLSTLEDAQQYFDNQLGARDKEVVLILGTSYAGLEHNKAYIDQTLKFYTPIVDSVDNTKVRYKGKTYTITAGDTTLTIDGKTYTIGEVAVHLFFKGHPAHPANEELTNYFNDNNIVVLPHRTPVETLFWMYNVKVGGYNSTSFLSCDKNQVEFFFGDVSGAVKTMQELGFFDGAVSFSET